MGPRDADPERGHGHRLAGVVHPCGLSTDRSCAVEGHRALQCGGPQGRRNLHGTAERAGVDAGLPFADPSHITYGSDFPYAPAPACQSMTRMLDAYPLTDDQRHAIDSGKAQRLFPRFAGPSIS
jgi:hypothetical protein